MQLNPNAISAVRKAFDKLDLSQENERIAALKAEIEEFIKAETRARARIDEIRDTLARPVLADGSKIADLLLSSSRSGDTGLASPSKEALEQEREALQHGIQELSRRSQANGQTIQTVQAQARRRIAEAADPLIETLEQEAFRLFEDLTTVFAAATALDRATQRDRAVTRTLREMVKEGMTGQRLWTGGSHIAVPADVCDLLESMSDRGPAVNIALVTKASPY